MSRAAPSWPVLTLRVVNYGNFVKPGLVVHKVGFTRRSFGMKLPSSLLKDRQFDGFDCGVS